MKSKLFLFISFGFLLTFANISCEKTQDDNSSSTSASTNVNSNNGGINGTEASWIKVRFRWRGQLGGSCDSGECGTCTGICVLITFREYTGDLTHEEIEAGDGYAEIEMVEDQLHLIFHASADNGSGTVKITEDFDIGEYAAGLLGYERVTIEDGTYEIDYSHYSLYGEAYFDVRTE